MKLDTFFKILNKEIFNSELDFPIFAYTYDDSMYGYHTVWDGQHILCVQDELPWFEGATTIAHEMIHQYQYDNGMKRKHGKSFKKIARKIEKRYNLRKGSI